MDSIQSIIERMRQDSEQGAIFWREREYSYGDFMDMVDAWKERLPDYGVGRGTVCAVLSEYSPQTCALFFALMEVKAIIVPFTPIMEAEMPPLRKIAGVQRMFRFNLKYDTWTFEDFGDVPQSELVTGFLARQKPGLIVFTSGSTGKPKGILHDCERVMHKFVAERPGWRTLLFLMMDHFGGFNTLLSAFAYRGMAVCLPERTPEAVCRTIEQSKATLLPTTPTFLNLLIASGSYRDFDLSSVKMITYGTEVMPDSTLQKLAEIFPNARVKQTYGLSELGVLRSRSESDDSPWLQIGGDGFNVKIVDGVLWVKSEANMVGYLNAPSPFDGEGWMCTGDRVEQRGDYIRILGRESEIINVGGQKVFPVEVETVLLEADNIKEATVFGTPHRLMGHVVEARVSLYRPEDPMALAERLRKHCLDRLTKYKVPLKFNIVEEGKAQHNDRFKKIRLVSKM
ncbi:MAG: long-chain fatty acid--CoA ligase [Chloroflexi bacterium]|nr:long-chain fatty acid--CoA ligase [Chloroflexota bacterium]